MIRVQVTCSSSVTEDESEESGLRPVAIVAAGRSLQEGAVSAVLRLDKGDPRVCADCGGSLGCDGDEGIVLRMEDECRNYDARDDPRRGGPVIVVLRGREAGIHCRNPIVEFP